MFDHPMLFGFLLVGILSIEFCLWCSPWRFDCC